MTESSERTCHFFCFVMLHIVFCLRKDQCSLNSTLQHCQLYNIDNCPPSLISLHCLHEETLGPKLPNERTVTTLDQTGRMPRLIWVFAGCTCHFVGFVRLHIVFCLRKDQCSLNSTVQHCQLYNIDNCLAQACNHHEINCTTLSSVGHKLVTII